MTKEFEMFGGFGVKVYSDIKTHDTLCDIWSASTKHPDARYSLEKDRDNGEFTWGLFSDEKQNTLQWLMLVASKQTFFFTACELIDIVNTCREG